ncbi:MAG: nickel pincer cofactor biosynthesis protein LarC [Deltaproteobacteria bacterium]|nr:nickel pincer cofactor biosynthesis protein LarC [Deltaproteobacteria bacterium]
MIAYFDCFSGISGDMTLGAFIDIGVPVKWLKETISAMPLKGFDLTVKEVVRNGISAKSVDVSVAGELPSRNYSKIKSVIENSTLSDNAKNISLTIFEKIADAEATIHKCEKENVHFHEVGAIDSIVDIVGTALCVEYLGITKFMASKIPFGKGFVKCQHGLLPVPAPATLAILKDVPVYGTDIEQELVTPTGAAIITTLTEEFGTIPGMVIEKIGYGAGKNENTTIPNLLRIMIGEERAALNDTIDIVETCIDDMNPEIFGYLMDRLFDDGALDVYWIPIFMKKNRPGTMIQVVCSKNKKEKIIHRILTETSTLGVRYYGAQRYMLERDYIEKETSYGLIPIKRVKESDGSFRLVPEYEVCKKIALEKNIPIKVVYEKILNECSGK